MASTVTITKNARQILRYGEAQIPYSIVVNPNRKQRVKINVHSDEAIEVETPERTAKENIARGVQKRARWIVVHVARAQALRAGSPSRICQRRADLLSRPPLQSKGPARSKRDRSVKLKGALLEVAIDDRSREAVRTLVKAWYREKAHDYFSDRAKTVARGMPWKIEVPPIRLRDMKKRWGSCAVDGAITLNPALLRAPRECIDYVIAHELCHLREHNHSRAFFSAVGSRIAAVGTNQFPTRCNG